MSDTTEQLIEEFRIAARRAGLSCIDPGAEFGEVWFGDEDRVPVHLYLDYGDGDRPPSAYAFAGYDHDRAPHYHAHTPDAVSDAVYVPRVDLPNLPTAELDTYYSDPNGSLNEQARRLAELPTREVWAELMQVVKDGDAAAGADGYCPLPSAPFDLALRVAEHLGVRDGREAAAREVTAAADAKGPQPPNLSAADILGPDVGEELMDDEQDAVEGHYQSCWNDGYSPERALRILGEERSEARRTSLAVADRLANMIREAHARGTNISEIARLAGVSRTWVHQVLRREADGE